MFCKVVYANAKLSMLMQLIGKATQGLAFMPCQHLQGLPCVFVVVVLIAAGFFRACNQHLVTACTHMLSFQCFATVR